MSDNKNANNTQETFSLLIWEEFPDDMLFYLIPNYVVDAENERLRKILEVSQGSYVNDVDGHKNQALVALNGACDHDDGELRQYQRDTETPLTGVVITAVYRSGILL